MNDPFLMSSLYLNRISITGEIPPDNYLSELPVVRHLQELVERDSQFIISTHSPILMPFPGAEILEITEDGIHSVDYQATEHFMITKRFMDAPEKMVKDLLGW